MQLHPAVHQWIDFSPDLPIHIMPIQTGEHAEFIFCHWHPLTEMIWVEAGTLELRIDQKQYTLFAGDLALVNPEEIHYGIEMAESKCKVYALVCDLSQLRKDLESSFYLRILKPLVEGTSAFMPIVRAEEVDLAFSFGDMIQTMSRAYEEHTPYYQEVMQAQLQLLLAQLHAHHKIMSRTEVTKMNDCMIIIKKAIRYMEAHFMEKMHISQIAAEVALSEDYFYKVFKKETGQTPSKYLQHVRLAHGRQLLRTTHKSISEIGEIIGFESTSYFIKQFKEAHGQSPKQYQKNFS